MLPLVWLIILNTQYKMVWLPRLTKQHKKSWVTRIIICNTYQHPLVTIKVDAILLASRSVRAVLRRQVASTKSVKYLLDMKEVYIYDNANYFLNATTGVIDNFKYSIQNGLTAVLNEAAQEVMSNAHNYLQYLPTVNMYRVSAIVHCKLSSFIWCLLNIIFKFIKNLHSGELTIGPCLVQTWNLMIAVLLQHWPPVLGHYRLNLRMIITMLNLASGKRARLSAMTCQEFRKYG